MKIQSVHHIGINTTDFAGSIAFYRDVLGLEFLEEADLGDDYVAYLKVDETSVIELFRTDGMEAKIPGDGYAGLKHLAFSVEDVDEWAECLSGQNVRITFGPADLPAIRKRVVLFEAPDHVIIELAAEMSCS